MARDRGGTTKRGDQPEHLPTSPTEIGRALRLAREQRGLDLLTVHDRLGRPITQLEALEAGDLAGLPDQAAALSTLRRYAAFLSLDGDYLALQLMETWSTTESGRPRPTRRDLPPLTGVVTAVSAGPDHLRAFTQTGQVPRVTGTSGNYGYGVATGPPTGTLPVIPRSEIKSAKRASARARRRRRAPTSLKLLTWLAVILVLAVVAGVVIQRERPQWLVKAHLLRVTQPDGSPVATSPPPTAAPHHHAATAPSGPVTLATTDNATKATYTVAAQQFTLNLATSAPCWVQVTSPASIQPLLEGVQPAGTIQSFKADGSITVQVGSSGVLVGVAIDGKNTFVTHPSVVPFTYTFTSSTPSP